MGALDLAAGKGALRGSGGRSECTECVAQSNGDGGGGGGVGCGGKVVCLRGVQQIK